jgi:hypothetical protein
MLADASFGTYASTGYVFDLFYNFHISSLLFQQFVLNTNRLVHNLKKSCMSLLFIEIVHLLSIYFGAMAPWPLPVLRIRIRMFFVFVIFVLRIQEVRVTNPDPAIIKQK